MKVMLVNPSQFERSGIGPLSYNPPMGLMSLAAVLEQHPSCEVRVVDAEALGLSLVQTADRVIDWCDVVGITATSVAYPVMRDLAKEIKHREPRIRVVVGGPHVSHDPKAVWAEGFADCVVAKEGEHVIVDVMTGQHKGEIVESSDFVDFAALSWPARHLIEPPLTQYIGNLPRTASPETSVNWERGCPHNCAFCSHPVFKNRPMKFRDPEDIVEELQFLVRHYGVKSIFVYDDELVGLSMKQNAWLHEILDLILHLGIKLIFKTQVRCNKRVVTRDLVEKMSRAGFHCVFIGCESGSQKVLDASNKGITPDDIYHTVRVFKEAGIETYTLWMLGNLEETQEDVWSGTLPLMQELEPWSDHVQINYAMPWNGSELAERAEAEGWIKERDPIKWLAKRPALHTPWMSPGEMKECRVTLLESIGLVERY